ncbi:hypothetical protein TIFTF001_056175 [Ficus carica]|uniref:Uncharacterized protein n=1 Tax=Ficus carica TaxID=3494 RepID=A0AA88EG19_FICCA|nr:hypothetical protein TIFTF001_056172 [Ficus carica]GMN74085.1 hypothetical protein TIFTF001_056173 [Ficus carica]GMN74088.1 hypothetical protein TIFTF001_056174 [Ficus carica]GMN74095.1 hypothetical protein TIFTF001_056175 [Ficus carica]
MLQLYCSIAAANCSSWHFSEKAEKEIAAHTCGDQFSTSAGRSRELWYFALKGLHFGKRSKPQGIEEPAERQREGNIPLLGKRERESSGSWSFHFYAHFEIRAQEEKDARREEPF